MTMKVLQCGLVVVVILVAALAATWMVLADEPEPDCLAGYVECIEPESDFMWCGALGATVTVTRDALCFVDIPEDESLCWNPGTAEWGRCYVPAFTTSDYLSGQNCVGNEFMNGDNDSLLCLTITLDTSKPLDMGELVPGGEPFEVR